MAPECFLRPPRHPGPWIRETEVIHAVRGPTKYAREVRDRLGAGPSCGRRPCAAGVGDQSMGRWALHTIRCAGADPSEFRERLLEPVALFGDLDGVAAGQA